jgi:hypothetical protein
MHTRWKIVIGCVIKKKEITITVAMKFMNPEDPPQFFNWLQKEDICWVEMESILKTAQPLTTETNDKIYVHLHENIKNHEQTESH